MKRNIKELRIWRLRDDEREQFAMDLDDFDKSAIYSVIIDATDGHQSHCVAIDDGWIFDSNENTALPLCRASLDYICCEGEREAKFKGFLSGYKFYSWKQTNGMKKVVQSKQKRETSPKTGRKPGRRKRKKN